MSELRYVIDICGLEEGIRCAICENPMHTDNGCDGGCKYNEKAFKRITDLLDKRIELLPIAPEPHWIPVTEATPTEDDDYWCTFGAETGWFVDWCSWYQGRWVVWTDNTVSEVRNVIAWCKPLEPYKGVTE